MAKTELHGYTVQEKLNKMSVDLIDVDVVTDADASGAPLAIVTEIPNAVAVKGGTAILQSCMFLSNKVLTDSFDVVITSKADQLQNSSSDLVVTDNVQVSALNTTSAVMAGTCGTFSINSLYDAGAVAIGDKRNIGMVCKAESDSTSLYFWMIAKGSTDWAEDTGVMRFGFIKD